MKNYYRILGVPKTATLKEIKKAYRAMAKQCHPDLSGDPNAEDRFIEITEAYDILSHESKRRQYDLSLHYSREKKQTSASEHNQEWMKKQQRASRSKAKTYAQMGYKQYEQEYLYDSIIGFVGPKIAGCFMAAIILVVVDGILIYFFLKVIYAPIVAGILFLALGPAIALASANIDYIHDKITMKKKMKRKRYKGN